MQSEIGVTTVAIEIKSASTERIIGTAFHPASISPVAWDRCNHASGGRPRRPLLLAPNCCATPKIERLGAAYADRITHRTPLAFDQIEPTLGHVDHNGARTL